jgi:hypothetical protein
MSVLEAVLAGSLALALLPAAVAAVNLAFFRPPRGAEDATASGAPRRVSVLVPARNEESAIEHVVSDATASRGVEVEVVVMDDHSTDATAAIVERLAAADPRVTLRRAPRLPAGWNGKQHACYELARAARHDVLVFVDADVRLHPDALARLAGELERRGADLLSGFPRQRTGSLLERLLIPLIHLVLLGYLPIPGMRLTRRVAFAAGCGQLMVARREAYAAAGGHAAIRASRHDGLALPRAFRRAGLVTDLCDLTELATCRMYTSAAGVWNGLAKNATEGMASAAAIVPWTLLLGGGHVLPAAILAYAALWEAPAQVPLLAGAAAAAGWATRFALAWRFRQSWLGALLHPISVALLLAIQWHALLREAAGRPFAWRGRPA